MSYILNIATVVPKFRIEKEDLVRFYAQAFHSDETSPFIQRLNLLNRKMKIDTRYSCIPDYGGDTYELYTDGNYKQPVEKRMGLYKEKILPLAAKAIDKLLKEAEIRSSEITHLITVSCTGVFAPGLEFLIAEHYGLQHTEKSAVNFLGCYAAMKALKQAHYIAESNPDACILIVSAELCSLHFYPSEADEDLIANLLFADGAAAVMMCGNKNKHAENKTVLKIEAIGSAFIPHTADLMTWNITSSAFRMQLSPEVVSSIKKNIQPVVADFLGNANPDIAYWAIHPGGVKIVEAVKESLGLTTDRVTDSMEVLQHYGNMSSPTILFILNKIFDKIKKSRNTKSKKIVACAFGPGLTIELIRCSSVETGTLNSIHHSIQNHAIEI